MASTSFTATRSIRPRTLADELAKPGAYATLANTRHVTVVETHVSRVFLLDHEVFKVKKGVDLGFVDFRSLEQRRLACEAEVRLNARLAPGIYHGVVPVCLHEDGHVGLGGQGIVVDWAVRMDRLPDAFRADRRLMHGSLTGELIDRIAEKIARFHGTASCGEREDRCGARSVIERNVRENFEQTKACIGEYLTAAQAEEVTEFQLAFLRDHEELFEDRVREGRIRDGHGDLRLEHVYVGEDRTITVIDCIEFSDRFRFADVAADVAFFSMDLAAHARVDLAERFLATYARETNDFDLYALVDFYESYRAFVRAKIASMRARDTSCSVEMRRRATSDARRYFLLALSSGHRPLVWPALVVTGGSLGAGKTTVANLIGEAMSAPVISADRTRKSMLGVEATRSLHVPAFQGPYDPAFSERVYEEVLRRAEVVLASGRPVVLDASFRSSRMREAARLLAMRRGVPFRFVECRAEPSVGRARLEERERTLDVSDGRLAIFDAFQKAFEPINELPAIEHIVLDTSRPTAETLLSLRSELDLWPTDLETFRA